MSQEERPQGASDPRDGLEGTYTEVDGEPEPERTVHGQYTRTERGGPDPEDEGAYADAEHDGGTEPSPHSTHDRHGKYNRRDQ
ncbi:MULTISPECIES: hypothetical protein [Microbacterium]|uniref:Uncharacterized protein n=1 Tax=Microbacterium azadirachtae TaxID=582680 RepID=A0A0F0LJC9_9MICO|nr:MULTISPECIES: hypothetical protein [Microbacterium]KJL32774.1 hypothetical protein RS86_02556 [Microbacterium azadirachtae]PRB03967.1 hypothetical protein CQ044_12420 [Microbacterium sp. MYb64]